MMTSDQGELGKLVISDQKLVISDQKLVISDQKLVISDQKLVISDQKLVISDQKLVIMQNEEIRELLGNFIYTMGIKKIAKFYQDYHEI